VISVLILTLNEEANLLSCLEAVSWSDDIVVFDSYSTDRTVEIARARGARVIQRKFDNERDHRAASLQIGFKYPWLYNPDADELTPPALRDEMLQAVRDAAAQGADSPSAFRCRFKTMFLGRWIRFSSLYPTWVVRLFRPDKVRFERTINLRYVIDGPEGTLRQHFEHYTFNNGIHAWFEKHNRYALHEARESLQSLTAGGIPWRSFFSRHAADRRRALKELSFRLPCRPLARFFYMYVVKLGFLDGFAGFHYCVLLAVYEYMIVLNVLELRRRQQGLKL